MTERQELLLLLAGLYLVECFRWVRRGSVIFRRLPGAGWQRRTNSEFIANDQGDLHWTFPLPDLGDFLVVRGLPWSVGPEGVATWHVSAAHPNGRTSQSATFRRWEEIKKIELENDQIFVADQPWWTADSPTEAQRLAGQLKRWTEMPAAGREKALRAELADSFAIQPIRQKLHDTDAQLSLLRQAGMLLEGILFVAIPVAVWQWGWFPALPAGLLATYATAIWIAWRSGILHQQWYPRATKERLRIRLLCGFSPLTAIRAVDLVGRNRVEGFDPLAVALALLPPVHAARMAAAWVRDTWYPLLPENPFPVATPAASSVAWFTTAYREAGAAALKSAGLEDADFRRAPSRNEPVNTQYCGRCHAQFLSAATGCRSCGGRPLLPLK